jgi:hypothetical protein
LLSHIIPESFFHQTRKEETKLLQMEECDLDYEQAVGRILAKCLGPDQKLMTILRAASVSVLKEQPQLAEDLVNCKEGEERSNNTTHGLFTKQKIGECSGGFEE